MSIEKSTDGDHWLHRYGNREHYQWRTTERNGRTTYYRPLGLAEFCFDTDGRHYEGRADINAQLELEIKSTLSHHDFQGKIDYRERILFAWACLRCQHLLLQSKALQGKDFSATRTASASDVYFTIDAPRTVSQAVEDAGNQLVFLADHFQHVDALDFWVHCQNTGRVFDPSNALAKLFVYPPQRLKGQRSSLKLLVVGSHQIWDGLTNYVWFRNFVHLLNKSIPELRQQLHDLLRPSAIFERLPPPQEALYPPVEGSQARQRWFWLLTRVLRHVRKPLQAGFANPLRRRVPMNGAVSLSPTYRPLLDYSKTPRLNSIPCFAKATMKGTKRLHRLCREANASVGAGCFALAALLMMEFYEQREPNIPVSERRPFISGFPLNPRAFFNHAEEPNSLMLAFCDGIILPFLPSDLDLDGRLRLLARQAHRQLAVFQKRQNTSRAAGGLQYMGSRGPGRLLQIQYISSLERTQAMLPEHLQTGLNPEGAFPMRPNATTQTCGVSSVGRREALIKPGDYDIDDESKDFVADFRSSFAAVRPRDGEFLVGVGGSDEGLWVNASVDGSTMDPALVDKWRERFETILDEGGGGEGRMYKL
ncbi:uncharacterized protein LTR77_001555 [Saxophila tyrrhenica]|uniref:Uncharacterized protein n=1 Tax=Saxophila tyrrhenica TaxID=1690608 RepID=A0AAV9PKM6_9PEZI|nr:hypothetical protein LTR77_001555 [Saxophila tyrrhenica]